MALSTHDQFQRDNHIKKLVSNAKAILSNQVAIPLGVSKMKKIVFWIDQIEPIEEIELDVFSEFMSLTENLPIGTERLTYSSDFLKKQDKELDNLTMYYKDQIIDKCFEIIGKFPS
jgi:5-methylcytosine-specific restriction endonuclease McrBC regulatory subunit McrC